MLTVAWKAVKPTTIAHYFKHAGFCASEEPVSDDARPDHQEAEDVATALDVGERLFADLRNSGMDIPGATTFREFADVDTALDPCAKLTDYEIVQQVLASTENESDSDDDCRPQP
ncbi:hypothetical protein HPB47_008123 [Ixodes persulcatus]|uniref:Uncharacterized protein n=1 Tax=Ixodes persulcatus TaxID=34615 RepID=A0AC60P5K9_IXOPE|nr:hypothetical protein HPB47_008123 [Ixodes persulcatus]